jgi:putative photosynthetic complex assembly protein
MSMDQTTPGGLFVNAEGRRKPVYRSEIISRRLVYAMFGLAFVSFVIVTASVLGDRPHTGTPVDGPVAFERTLTLKGTGNAVFVTNEAGLPIMDTDNGGFIAVVIDGLERARHVAGTEGNPPVIITQYENGRLSLYDPASSWRTELSSFGPGNLAIWQDLVTR